MTAALAVTSVGEPSAGRLNGNRAWWALVPLLLGTFCGTLNNNIVNVPLKIIMHDLGVPLAQGALVVILFNLTFAVLMPLTGWLGDRMGRRRMYCAAVVVLGVGAVGAALSPTLPVLLAFRVMQGAATAAILPTVMGLISDIFGTERRGRALGLWAAVNGLGQAVGPPVGGVLATWFGWRSIFWPVVPLCVVAYVGALRLVPGRGATALPLDVRGAVALTLGASGVLGAAAAVPHAGLASVTVGVLASVGLASLAWFIRGLSKVANPFISASLLREPSYVRSSLAVFAQMFCLGTTLLGVPLYLTSTANDSTLRAGLLVFVLPAVMTLLAPAAGVAAERLGPRPVIRTGLVLLVLGEAVAAAALGHHMLSWLALVTALAVVGVGVALVQTPAATGATRSPAGRYGTGLGLFNLVRFAGSALGAAWVAIELGRGGSYAVLFGVAAAVAVAAFVGTFVGLTPQPSTTPSGLVGQEQAW